MTMHEDKAPQKTRLDFLRALVQGSLVIWAAVLLCSRPYLLKMVRVGEYSPSWLLLGPAIFLGLFLVFLAVHFFQQETQKENLADFLPLLFGLAFIAILFQASLKEYQVRSITIPLDISFLHEFSQSKDARIRALSMLAAPRNNLSFSALGSLLHRGLLDKDPLVQHAARMVIEDNLGIRLKNGDEGLHQARELIREGLPHAVLVEKGVP